MWKCRCGGENPDSANFCQSCASRRLSSEFSVEKKKAEIERYEENTRRRVEQEQQQEQHRLYEEQRRLYEEQRRINNSKIENLKKDGFEGYWEYKVLDLNDEKTGIINPVQLANILNELGLYGWRLKCAYSNEIGHNSTSVGIGPLGGGVNSTIDQNVFILERYVKI